MTEIATIDWFGRYLFSLKTLLYFMNVFVMQIHVFTDETSCYILQNKAK